MNNVIFLRNEIDRVREKLERRIEANLFALVDLEVVKMSQELDRLLNKYNKLTIK